MNCYPGDVGGLRGHACHASIDPQNRSIYRRGRQTTHTSNRSLNILFIKRWKVAGAFVKP